MPRPLPADPQPTVTPQDREGPNSMQWSHTATGGGWPWRSSWAQESSDKHSATERPTVLHLAVNGEGLPTAGAEAVDREVCVEGDCLADAQAMHDRPACAVHEGELLVVE